MAAALLSSFHDMKQRRRKSVRVTFTMRTASFSVVRFFSLLLSTAWVGLVGYREIPIRTLHLNVHTHTHTHTHRDTHTYTLATQTTLCQPGPDTSPSYFLFVHVVRDVFSFIRPTSCSANQREPCRSWCDCVLGWQVLQYIADQHKFVTSTQMIR